MPDKQFIEATKAWLVTQDLSIESCDINISHYKRQIENLKKSITAEERERAAKVELKNDVTKRLKKAETQP